MDETVLSSDGKKRTRGGITDSRSEQEKKDASVFRLLPSTYTMAAARVTRSVGWLPDCARIENSVKAAAMTVFKYGCALFRIDKHECGSMKTVGESDSTDNCVLLAPMVDVGF